MAANIRMIGRFIVANQRANFMGFVTIRGPQPVFATLAFTLLTVCGCSKATSTVNQVAVNNGDVKSAEPNPITPRSNEPKSPTTDEPQKPKDEGDKITNKKAPPMKPSKIEAKEPLKTPDNETNVIRYWNDPAGKTLLVGEFLESVGDQIKFKIKETGKIVSHKQSELCPGDLQYIKHWSEPTKRAALRKFGENVRCDSDGSIGLMLSQSGCTDNDLKLVASLPELVTIDLYQCHISDEGLSALTGLRKLRSLHIDENDVKGPGFKHLGALTSLEDLSYSPERGRTLTITSHIHHLTALKYLKTLALRFCTVGADGLKPIGQMTNLESLDFLEAEINSPALEHLKGLTKLRKLDLGGNRISDADMVHIGSMTELRYLDVGSGNLTGDGLKHVAKLDRLERIDLPRSLRDDDLQHLSTLTKLKWLRVGENTTDKGLAHIEPLRNLEELFLSSRITSAGLKHLEGLTRLRRLEFEGDGVTFSQAMKLLVDKQKRSVPEALRVLLSHGDEKNEKVTHLSLDFRPRADIETLKYLAELPDLEGLSLGKETTDEWLKSVGLVKNLRSLSLRGDRFNKRPLRLSLAGLKELAACQKLESIEFHDCELGKNSLSGVESLPRLKNLSVSDCNFAEGNATAWSKMAALEQLWISNANVTDRDLSHLAGLKNLKYVTVPEGITLDGLAHLKDVKSLTSVQARWAEFRFADVYKLFTEKFGREPNAALGLFLRLDRSADGKVTGLEWAYDLKATAKDLTFLRKLTDLESLSLPQDVTNEGLKNVEPLSKLRRLSFTSTMVTDTGLAHLTGLTNLEELSINQAPITDDGLKHLEGLRKLESVYLSNSKITEKGITELQKAIPQARIRK
jgi:Leucine-rich repeat (LRR) protein